MPHPIDPQLLATRLRSVSDRDSFFAFLADESGGLGWTDVSPDTTFDYTADELALGESSGQRIHSIQQIQNISANQPFGVFLIEFTSGKSLETLPLRAVLRGLSESRRDALLNAWNTGDLIFFCTADYKEFSVAHFRGSSHTRATISVFGWKHGGTALQTLCKHNLPCLRKPEDLSNANAWREQWVAAWDVEAATKRFYREFKRVFLEAEDSITGIASVGKKRLYTLRLFNRLMFIHFLGKKGWLEAPGGNNDKDYLQALWDGRQVGSNFYETHLSPLFFAALNNPQSLEIKNPAMESLVGRVPFLNGGLFAKAAGGDAVIPGDMVGENVPDSVCAAILSELFAPFNFTITESTLLFTEVAVDPEMLGQVFEELVNLQTEAGNLRKDTGSYYTPRPIVSFMCRETLKGYLSDSGASPYSDAIYALVDADTTDLRRAAANHLPNALTRDLLQRLRDVTVCDPACGSGAYLLGMLGEIFDLAESLELHLEEPTAHDRHKRKLAIIERNLYGADLEPFATDIARLRLWLSLVVDDTRNPLKDGTVNVALPNLDFKIECGDSLSAPNPGSLGLEGYMFKGHATKLKEMYREFFNTREPDVKARLYKEIAVERDKIRKLLGVDPNEIGMDWRVAFAQVFAPRSSSGGSNEPALGGFDIVLANPPYGANVADAVRDRYFDRSKTDERGMSKDTYGLFMARALQLLAPGGQFSMIVSDTWRTIKTFRPLRKRLLKETSARHVLDVPSWVFETPTVNTSIVTLTKRPPKPGHTLIAGDLRAIPPRQWDTLTRNLRAVATHSPDVQTLDYARYTVP